MPNDNPGEKLEWNEANLSAVISDLVAQASTDQTVYDQLTTNPFDLLNTRVDVPETYRGLIVVKAPTAKLLVINVPPPGEGAEALPAGTREATPAKNFEIICTVDPEW